MSDAERAYEACKDLLDVPESAIDFENMSAACAKDLWLLAKERDRLAAELDTAKAIGRLAATTASATVECAKLLDVDAEERIAALEQENAELRGVGKWDRDDEVCSLRQKVATLAASKVALEADNAELRAALKPLAVWEGWIEAGTEDGFVKGIYICVRDIRRAAALLAAKGGDANG